MSRLRKKIEKKRQAGRYALIPFITAGFPDMATFIKIVCELDRNGADIIEIGVPFSDPVADGPVVEEASRKALQKGMSLNLLLDQLTVLAPVLQTDVVLMGYYNPFLQYGLEKLADQCREAKVAGFIVPDLPLEESAPFKRVLDERHIDLIPLVGPNTSRKRMREYKPSATGYVYAVSLLGTTGVQGGLRTDVSDTIGRAREVFEDLPVALGFGLQHPEQLQYLSQKPDALVFGSALILHLQNKGTVESFMRPWRNAKV